MMQLNTWYFKALVMNIQSHSNQSIQSKSKAIFACTVEKVFNPISPIDVSFDIQG